MSQHFSWTTYKTSWMLYQHCTVIWNKELLGMLYAFFCVIPRLLNFVCQRFGTLCFFHLHRPVGTLLRRWNRQSVLKCCLTKFRRQGNTQKKAYNIQNTAKVWNPFLGKQPHEISINIECFGNCRCLYLQKLMWETTQPSALFICPHVLTAERTTK